MKKLTAKSKIKLSVIISVSVILILALAFFLTAFYGMLTFYHPNAKASDGQIRVACVGDSITYGNGISNWFENTYPEKLNEKLGDEYYVGNFGYSGRTAMETGDHPYSKEKLYTKSLAFKPDIVVIMFGTNDTKTQNYKDKESFKTQYIKLIKSYEESVDKNDIYICIPPQLYEVKWNMQKDILDSDIISAVKEIAEENGYNLIDIRKAFENGAHLFSDGVHPNSQGAEVFSQCVYDAIMKK